MALFWVEAEHVKRAVQRFNRSLKNFGSADVDVRTLYTEAVSKCDDLCKRFLHEGAMHNVATWVEADTRYDVFAALKRLHTISASLQALKEASACNGNTGNGITTVTAAAHAAVKNSSSSSASTQQSQTLSPTAVKYSHASIASIESECNGSAQTAAMVKLSEVVDIAQTKLLLSSVEIGSMHRVFTAMLFDYLPGFITSEHLNQAKTGITSGDALKELLETGVRSAKITSTTSTSTPPVMIDSPMKPSSRKQLLSSADSLLLQSYDSREANASGSVTAAAAAVAASADSSNRNTTGTTTADTYAAIDETPSEHSRALVASMQLHAVVSDPCCSMYLESYLSKVTARSKKTSSKTSTKTSTKGELPVELQVDAFAPDLIMACLLEIDDFKRAEDRAHRNHRAQLIISRYGIPEFEVQDLIQMRTACVREVDPSAFDLVYVLLSTRLLIEHAQGFIESSEFKELDRVLQQQNAFSSTGDTASKVGNIRNFVLEKLGLKESVHTGSAVAVAAQNEALQNVEDLLKTLEGVLSLALGRSLFKRFSTQQFQEENVCFFLEVMFYKLKSYLTPAEGSVIYADRTNVPAKQSTNTTNSCKIAAQGEMELSEMRRLRAEHIAAKYIEVGSKRQINISSAMRHIILDGVKPPVTTTVNDDGTTSTSGGNSSANMSYDKSKQGVKSRLQIGGFTSMTSLDSASMATAITTASTGTTAATTSATTTSATSGRCAAPSERTAASGRKATTTTTAAAAPAVPAIAPPVTAAAAAVADDTPAAAEAVMSDTVCTQSDYDAAVWTPSLNVFDVAQKEVLHLMKQNLWLKFTGSPLYDSLVRQISKRATIGVMVRAGKISTALVQGATKHQQ
eukprot:8202-Heterococcus_DN1.PRE.1